MVPPADARALSDALSWLLADTQRRRALGEAAAARASAHFTSQAMLEALAEVYTATATAPAPVLAVNGPVHRASPPGADDRGRTRSRPGQPPAGRSSTAPSTAASTVTAP